MGWNIPGGNFLSGNFPGGNFPDTRYSIIFFVVFEKNTV